MDKKVFKGSLYLVIYTIGYSEEGESIVIFIKTGNIIVYSIVIDGYKVKDCNITHKLLLEKGIEHIDVFCWTHPDKDHSIGIEEYIPFIDKESLIIIGDGFLEIKEEWQNANEKMYFFIENELRKDIRMKNKVTVRKVCTGLILKKISFQDVNTGINYLFQLHAFAPSDYLNLRGNINEKTLIKNNISVGLDLTIGNVSVIFGGDVPNSVFHAISEDEIPEFVDYIKIPHHCSLSSDKLLHKIKNCPEVACTTVKTASNLPNRELLEKYKKKVNQVYCTNDLEKEIQNEKWGCLETSFLINDLKFGVTNVIYGNANLIGKVK